MDREPARIDAEPYGVVNQRERDYRQQRGEDYQYESYLSQRVVDRGYEVLLVVDVGHSVIRLQLGCDILYRVVVGIVGLELYLYLGRERVLTGKLRWVGT